MLLKVMAGDSYNLRVASGWNSASAPNNSSTNVLADLLNALTASVAGASGGKVTALDLQNPALGLSTALSNFASTQSNTAGKPKAYINWVLLDEHFAIARDASGNITGGGYSGSQMVGNSGTTTIHTLSNLTVAKSGYLYIYTSNESQSIDVFFDNLQVTHNRGAILEETHYYPFGLTMATISSKAAGMLDNKRKFNGGSNLENKEFSDASGLELYSTAYRNYDPQIGRFHQIDPWAGLSNEYSLYAYCMNNPILFNDPLGLDTVRINGNGSHKIQIGQGDVLAWTIDKTTSYYTYDPNNKDAVNGFVGGAIQNDELLPDVMVTAKTKARDNSNIQGLNNVVGYLSLSQGAAEYLGGFDNAMKLLQEGKFQAVYNGQLKTWSLNFYGNKSVAAEFVQINKNSFAMKAVGNFAYYKAVKAGGVFLNVAGIFISAWDMKQNGINGKNVADMSMGFVAFIPGGGWVVSSGYFLLDTFYPGGVKGFVKDEGQRNASLNELCGCDNQAYWY